MNYKEQGDTISQLSMSKRLRNSAEERMSLLMDKRERREMTTASLVTEEIMRK